MSELTISANEITDALRRHVAEYNPSIGAERIGRIVRMHADSREDIDQISAGILRAACTDVP